MGMVASSDVLMPGICQIVAVTSTATIHVKAPASARITSCARRAITVKNSAAIGPKATRMQPNSSGQFTRPSWSAMLPVEPRTGSERGGGARV